MNPIQKQWLGLGAAVMAAMLIYPPWVKITHPAYGNPVQTDVQQSAGYSWLLEPPKPDNLEYYYTSIEIDYARLLTQWAVAAFVIGAGLLFFKDSDKKSLAEWWSSVGGSAKPAPPSNPPKPRPPPAPPVSRSVVPPAVGGSETKQRNPPNENFPWRRAMKPAGKAFGFGGFLGIAGIYGVQSGFSFGERMLCALCCGLFCGLLFAAVTFVVAGLYFAAKGGPQVAEGRSSLTASTKSRPTTAHPKPTAPDLATSEAQMSLDATLNQAEKVLRQALPVSEKQLPTHVGSRNPSAASPTPRAAEWLYFDQQAYLRGPVSEAELEKLFAGGEIRAGASVRSEGLPEWVPFLQRHRPVEIAPQPLGTRPLRIVSVDDEGYRLEFVERMISHYFKGVTVESFQDAEEAWQELSRTDPDLLITDDIMGKLNGDEIVRRLTERKVAYPIIVIQGYPKRDQWVLDCVKRGEDVTLLRAPYSLESLATAVKSGLNISRDIILESVKEKAG